MVEIVLLRHAQTRGNLEGRYIGCRTDEPLCEEGRLLLAGRLYPAVERIYTSPMKRCVETAQAIWGADARLVEDADSSFGVDSQGERRTIGRSPLIVVPELRECDFGAFENKNYEELNGDPRYQAWIDSGGTLPFPDGESMETFRRRCQTWFAQFAREIARRGRRPSPDGNARETEGLMKNKPYRVAVVAHGGTVMAIMERFGFPKRGYFDYQVKNGCGYLLTPALEMELKGTELEGTGLWNYQCLP